MQKKIIALCVLLTSVTYVSADYPATGGYQPDNRQHHRTLNPQDLKAVNDIDAQIETLNKATQDPNVRLNIAYLTGCIGVGLIGLGAATKNWQTAVIGGIVTTGSVGGGLLASHGDQKRLEQNEKSKLALMKMREDILKAYRN